MGLKVNMIAICSKKKANSMELAFNYYNRFSKGGVAIAQAVELA